MEKDICSMKEENKMLDIKDRNWKDFFIEEIATINSGRDIYEAERKKGNNPYVSSSSVNNGICHFVSNENATMEARCISVNRNGSVGYAFYHPYKALYSNDCRKLRLKYPNKYVAIFITTQITAQRGKYSYGYKMGTGRLKRQKIMLPIDKDGNPDYAFMEQYIKEREKQIIQKYISYIGKNAEKSGGISGLTEKKWKEFSVGDLFIVKRPKARSEKQYKLGEIPFVASGNVNNGVIKCCNPKKDEQMDKGNCITVSPVDGSAFYQETDFLGRGGAGSSILMLYNADINKYSGLFLSRMIRQTCSKYSYGKMGNQESIKREKIMIPIDEQGNPDYAFMEEYSNIIIRDLRIKYLKKKIISI